MLKNKTFSGFLKVCSVLPALAVMPAMGAINLSSDTDIGSSEYEDGKYSSGIIDTNIQVTGGHVVLNTPTIEIENDASYSVYAGKEGTVLELGTQGTDTITIHHTAAKELDKDNKVVVKAAVVSAESGTMSIGNKSTSKIDITSDNVYGAYASGNLNMTAQDITITSALHGLYLAKGNATVNAGNTLTITSTAANSYGIYNSGGVLDITAGAATITSNASYGIYNTGTLSLNANTVTITSNSSYGVVVTKEGSQLKLGTDVTTDINVTSKASNGIMADSFGQIHVGNKNTTNNLTITGEKNGAVAQKDGVITLAAQNIRIESTSKAAKTDGLLVNNTSGSGVAKAIVSGGNVTVISNGGIGVDALGKGKNVTFDENGNVANRVITSEIKMDVDSLRVETKGDDYIVNANNGAMVDITSNSTITLKGAKWGISTMSGSILKMKGKTTLTVGDDENDTSVTAIGTRGNSLVEISDIQKMIGAVNFNYNKSDIGNSEDFIDSTVHMTLGEGGTWKGNSVLTYAYLTPGELKTEEEKKKFDLNNGLSLTMKQGSTWTANKVDESWGEEGTNSGMKYARLFNLTVDGGKINIEDDENGVQTLTANISDAEINEGTLTILESLDLTSSMTGTGSLNIASGATANIGDSLIDLKSITLDGTMNAVLDLHNPLFGASDFSGDGSLNLTAKKEGEYNLTSGNNTFSDANISVTSTIFNTEVVDNNTISVALKSVDEIAADNGLSSQAAQTAANLAKSSSEKLNDFGVLVQESLARGDSASVERAHRAINPSDVSAVQSVTTHVQSNIAKLAAGRMAMPVTGRAGGDIDMTANGVWAQGMFNKSKLNGEFDAKTRGIAAGVDGTFNRVFTVGAGYAFNNSDVDINSRNVDIDSNTLFVYGQYKPSEWFVNATINYTMSDYNENETVLGTLIESDYTLDALSGQVMVGYDFANGITPEVGMRYIHIMGDTYTNSLGIRNKIADADYMTAMMGAKYGTDFRADVNNDIVLRPEIRAAIKYDFVADDSRVAVTMPGIDSYAVRADSLDALAGEFGFGLTMKYMDVDLSLNYEIEVRKDYTSQTGILRARYNF